MARGEAKPKEQKPIEQTLWDAANKLRGKVEPAEYKHVLKMMESAIQSEGVEEVFSIDTTPDQEAIDLFSDEYL